MRTRLKTAQRSCESSAKTWRTSKHGTSGTEDAVKSSFAVPQLLSDLGNMYNSTTCIIGTVIICIPYVLHRRTSLHIPKVQPQFQTDQFQVLISDHCNKLKFSYSIFWSQKSLLAASKSSGSTLNTASRSKYPVTISASNPTKIVFTCRLLSRSATNRWNVQYCFCVCIWVIWSDRYIMEML